MLAPQPLGYRGAYIDVNFSDIKRWKLALASPHLSVPINGLVTRVQNFPTAQDIARQWSIYLGFSISGFIYGGLHCLAWNAPLTSNTERLIWRLASTMTASTGILVLLMLSWQWEKPFWVDPMSPGNVYLSWWNVFETWRAQVMSDDTYNYLVWILIGPFMILFFLKYVWDLFLAALILLYVAARVYLIVECFINLGHLPPSAYQLPQWSQYVPHIA